MIENDQTLTGGGLDTDTTLSREISGDGGFYKVGEGTTNFSGANTYRGNKIIDDGVLLRSNFTGTPQTSHSLVTGTGQLDLRSEPTGKGEFKIDRLSIEEVNK